MDVFLGVLAFGSYVGLYLWGWIRIVRALESRNYSFVPRHLCGFFCASILAALVLPPFVYLSDKNIAATTVAISVLVVVGYIFYLITRSISPILASTPASKKEFPSTKTTPPVPLITPEKGVQVPNAKNVQRPILSFVYEDADGNVTTRNLSYWEEDEVYIEGFCLNRKETRTFKKERVLSYLDDSDRLLSNPYPIDVELKKSRKPIDSSEILFTGFGKAERADLEILAQQAGLRVCQTVTVGLDYICTGKNAGPTKLAHALANGAIELNADEFHQLIETGEVPLS